jgi:LPXTG-site transpeptidase (sortase) family protein
LVDTDDKTKERPIRWKLPITGFAPDTITKLPPMPENFSYTKTNFWLEVQKLGLKTDIVGIPFDKDKGEWNITWLYKEAGWLDGTAYPTHEGNSALTAHVTLADGTPGPFAKLNTLNYGDQVIIHLDGQKYIYEVRNVTRVRPDVVDLALKHEKLPWLTLITCDTYDKATGGYAYRTVVRAVLLKVADE